MKGARDDLSGKNPDGTGERAVECTEKIRRWNASLQWKARYLGESVYTGIGAARSLGQRRLADNACEGGLQFALDGAFAGLHLPPVEVGSVIGDDEFPGLYLFRFGLRCVCHGVSML